MKQCDVNDANEIVSMIEGKKMAILISLSWYKFTLDTKPDDQIVSHFKFYELTRSETAERRNIDNTFETLEQLQSAVYLCRKILQPVREQFGRFSPNSVYRSQELERALKKKRKDWISKSQHTQGRACDIEIPGLPTIELAHWVREISSTIRLFASAAMPRRNLIPVGSMYRWFHRGWARIGRSYSVVYRMQTSKNMYV